MTSFSFLGEPFKDIVNTMLTNIFNNINYLGRQHHFMFFIETDFRVGMHLWYPPKKYLDKQTTHQILRCMSLSNIDIWNGLWAHIRTFSVPADTDDIWPVLLLMGMALSAIGSSGEASIYEINLSPPERYEVISWYIFV